MVAKLRKGAWVLLVQLGLVGMVLGSTGVKKAMAKHESAEEAKPAILVVAFGTSVPEAQKAYDLIDQRIAAAFPKVERRWAYTSSIIRKKLRAQGQSLDAPETALAKLMEDGFTHVAVMSLHIIPGAEFHDLYTNARFFAQMVGGFKKVTFAQPLISSAEDMVQVARAMAESVPLERKPNEAVIYMGHGSEHHPADAAYVAMDSYFRKQDSNMYLATVEGALPFENVLSTLKSRRVPKAYLVPFMVVAGDHARNDMAGEEPDSWKSQLEAQGIKAVPVFRGMGEVPAVVDVWIRHLQSAMEALGMP
ncbi:sirohydrochlorin cobaltochelatase [Desulfosoma caldarium]|uniref:Sirohydrochlorin cobaltochelatase n=1 Tax=Desulfosoma caldarium TaxID=610254 RepID=A0A3N1VIE6_9BACT|nr:sirohydrochlorin cobaltochelatase [Desulfosoma caldarium]ROR01809.1 sirohydrochlorin cobaltochelatase [Desulfosoma caldarium]